MGLKSKTQAIIADSMEKRKPFVRTNVSGKWIGEYSSSFGRLPKEHQDTMRELLKDRDLYVVYSYQTPIAYADQKDFVVPDVYYSASTTQQQNVVRFIAHTLNKYNTDTPTKTPTSTETPETDEDTEPDLEYDKTYKIVRRYQDSAIPNETVETGLTLEEAQEHCTDKQASSRTSTTPEGIERTFTMGEWFDSYTEE